MKCLDRGCYYTKHLFKPLCTGSSFLASVGIWKDGTHFLMSCLLFDYFFFLSLLQYVDFPNANLLVFLFSGFIVIPKPSQLSQWNSSIATIFLLLKNPATQSLMLLFTLQALQVFLFFSTPPSPSFVNGFSVVFCFITHST